MFSWHFLIPTDRLSCLNTLRPRKRGRHFADGIFKCMFVNDNVWIPIKISLKFIPRGPINNIPALVRIMAWRRSGDKPLFEPMMIKLLTHICVARPQWVNWGNFKVQCVCSATGVAPPTAEHFFFILQPEHSFRPWHDIQHFADDIINCILLNENIWTSNEDEVSLKYVRFCSCWLSIIIGSVMVWCRIGDKPLPELHVVMNKMSRLRRVNG